MKRFRRICELIQSINPGLRFIFLLAVFVIVYDYPSLILKRPQSVHHWRQSDCASIALNYYQDGMRFFQPQTHNLTSDGSTTGYSAPSEIPIGYYFVASLYKVFGYHDFIYRFINTLIFLLGLFYLFKLCYLLFKDFFWSAVSSLLFFTSPVLVYYGNNFLSDSSALAFALTGWYFLLKFYLSKKQWDFIISIVFFLFAGAFKITALISLVAITIIFIVELVRVYKFRNEGKIFERPVFTASLIILVFAVIVAWVYFAKQFNNSHNSVYFSTRIIPIWELDGAQIQAVIKNIKGLWLDQYFHDSALYFLAGAFLFSILFIKKANRFLMLTNILLLTGTIGYVVLWFPTFKDHDYYTINLYIFLVFIMINFGWVLKHKFPKVFSTWYLKIIFLGFLLFNLNHAQMSMYGRYYGWWTEYPEYKDYHIVSPYLRSIGIEPLDTVVCLPDMTHFTLYLMNQRGWTGCLGYNSDSTAIETSISRGAKYLIIHGEETINLNYLQSFMTRPIGQFNSIKIFKLDKPFNSK